MIYVIPRVFGRIRRYSRRSTSLHILSATCTVRAMFCRSKASRCAERRIVDSHWQCLARGTILYCRVGAAWRAHLELITTASHWRRSGFFSGVYTVQRRTTTIAMCPTVLLHEHVPKWNKIRDIRFVLSILGGHLMALKEQSEAAEEIL